jgi:hypothetical protein
MQKILRILFFFVLVFTFSCEEQGFIVKCSECTADEPVDAVLEVKLDPDYYYDSLIQIWEGNLEDSLLLGSYTSHTETFTQSVTLNKKYTVTATYHTSDKTYVAVDSSTPRVRYDKSQCQDNCYFVYDRILDLRLKYTK